MPKEIIVKHNEIRDPQTITDVMEAKFKEKDLNIHVNEVVSLEDDNKKGIRRIEIKNTKYFFINEIPWKKEE